MDKIANAIMWLGLAIILHGCNSRTIVIKNDAEPTWAMCKGYEVGNKIKEMAE